MSNKLRTYETICLTKVDMPDDKFNALMERCKASVANEGKGEWLYTDDWGKAKISYKIGKDSRARWTYMRFKSLPQGVDELLRGLSINEFVLRQQTCKTTEDGADYNAYREVIAQDVSERGERRDFRDERPSRGGYYRRDSYERNAPHANENADSNDGDSESAAMGEE